MMNTMELLKTIGPEAGPSAPRLGDVSAGVLQGIRRRQWSEGVSLKVVLLAGIPAAGAVAAAIAVWLEFTNPLNDYFQQLVVVMQ